MKESITRSELVQLLTKAFEESELTKSDINMSVREIINHMSATIANGDRIEIRGFGSFTLRQRKPRMGRNPKTGDPVPLGAKYAPHFKPGKDLKEKIKDKVGE